MHRELLPSQLSTERMHKMQPVASWMSACLPWGSPKMAPGQFVFEGLMNSMGTEMLFCIREQLLPARFWTLTLQTANRSKGRERDW